MFNQVDERDLFLRTFQFEILSACFLLFARPSVAGCPVNFSGLIMSRSWGDLFMILPMLFSCLFHRDQPQICREHNHCRHFAR